MPDLTEHRAALAEDLCHRICGMTGEPRLFIPGEIEALLLASPQFAHLIAAAEARGGERVREAVEGVHVRESHDFGPDFCAYCSRLEQEWNPWPCQTVAAQRAAIAATNPTPANPQRDEESTDA